MNDQIRNKNYFVKSCGKEIGDSYLKIYDLDSSLKSAYIKIAYLETKN